MAATNPHTIDRWDYAIGENLIEQIAGDGDYLVALATNRAAVKRWPKGTRSRRNRARANGTGTVHRKARLDAGPRRIRCPHRPSHPFARKRRSAKKPPENEMSITAQNASKSPLRLPAR